MKYYYVEIDMDDDETGVFFNSIVEVPAHLRKSIKFSGKKENNYAIADEDQQIIAGVMISADQPIYRNDNELGEYYVIFKGSEISKIIHKFHRLKLTDQLNLDHDPDKIVDKAYMFMDYQVNRAEGLGVPKSLKNHDNIKDGSWIAYYKITDPNIWKLVKEGNYNGFSVEVASYMKPAKVKGIGEGETDKMAMYAMYKYINRTLKTV